METFQEQLDFYTGVTDYESPLRHHGPTNMPKILAKLGLLDKEKIGKYPEKISFLNLFTKDPEIFGLYLLYLMTRHAQAFLLTRIHSMANQLLTRISVQSQPFQANFLTHQDVLECFQDLKELMGDWRTNTKKLIDEPKPRGLEKRKKSSPSHRFQELEKDDSGFSGY